VAGDASLAGCRRLAQGWETPSLDASEFPEEIRAKLITAKLELPLRYLQYRRLITYARRSDGMLYAAVTFAGGRSRHPASHPAGRMDLWYREHRDGIVGVTITVLIAFITALVTVLVINKNTEILGL